MFNAQKFLYASIIATAALAPTFASAATPLQMARQECKANGGVECACLEALQSGDAEKLRDFQRRYASAGTVCNVQAKTIFGEDPISRENN